LIEVAVGISELSVTVPKVSEFKDKPLPSRNSSPKYKLLKVSIQPFKGEETRKSTHQSYQVPKKRKKRKKLHGKNKLQKSTAINVH
jgi:hypothetical protein